MRAGGKDSTRSGSGCQSGFLSERLACGLTWKVGMLASEAQACYECAATQQTVRWHELECWVYAVNILA